MSKKKLLAILAKKEARKSQLVTKSDATEDIKELRSINSQLDDLNTEIIDIKDMISEIEQDEEARKAQPPVDPNIAAMPPQTEEEKRSLKHNGVPVGEEEKRFNPIATYKVGTGETKVGNKEEREAQLKSEAEERGKNLLEGRSITVASSNVLLAKYTDNTLSQTFNEVSSLIDRVFVKSLIGGESYSKGYVKGYGTGDYTTEGNDYNTTEPTFGYADITKTKVTSYAEDTEELLKLSAADYDAEVRKGVTIASRKKITREILIGTGATGHLVGIFSTNATAIDSDTDLAISEINEDTLDEIIFGFGGDEDVEATSTLILSKADLKAFSKLRDANGKKIYDITVNGNIGTINTIPYIINSACNAISNVATTTGQYAMAYGPLTNYTLTIFSNMDIQRSTDYLFKKGMIANRSSVFVGGNVTAHNGFLRLKKA